MESHLTFAQLSWVVTEMLVGQLEKMGEMVSFAHGFGTVTVKEQVEVFPFKSVAV